jgi:hypothetical protein
MITEESRSKNLKLFFTKLEELGVNIHTLQEKYGELLKNASYSNNSFEDLAYDGSLLKTVLYMLTPIALEENETFKNFKVDKNKLIKVCLLQHVSKAVRMVPNNNKWEIENRGFVYKYREDNPSIKTGLHSVALMSECNIQLSPDEIEAMTIIDKDCNDTQSYLFSSILTEVVRIANSKTYLISRESKKYKNGENKK